MPFQPIVISRENAERELAPYILRRRTLVHRSFDRRLINLDRTMGNPLLQSTSQIDEVTRLLNEIRAIALSQRNFLEQHIRGTANPGTASRPGTQPARRGRGSNPAPLQPVITRWLSSDQVRHMLLCLLPYINHRIVMNTGNTTGITSRECDLNTDSFQLIRQIHSENQLITTINPNYRDQSRITALNHYSERLGDIIRRLNGFISSTVSLAAQPSSAQLNSLATSYIQQQTERPTINLAALTRRIEATTDQLRNRYSNILRSGMTIQYARDHGFDPAPVITVEGTSINNEVDNPVVVVINWNHPDLVPIKHLPHSRSIYSDPIDLIFAVAITRFLKHIKATLHVVEVYSDGFIRNPLGLDDPHPSGRAWDLTGFGINITSFRSGSINNTAAPAVLHLRGGYPVTNLRGPAHQHAAIADLSRYHGGPSDWFNIALVTENVYREQLSSSTGIAVSPNSRAEYLRRIINVMPSFFGFVKGPGSDINHMDHFHIDLARSNSSARAIFCPATMLNPNPFIPLPRPAVLPGASHSTRPGR